MPAAEIVNAARTRLSFSDPADVDAFVEKLGKFERGEIGADEWRAFRLIHGTYGQRQEGDLSMLRVKAPEGLLLADQVEALADVAERHGRGFGHVTTRQNLQFHFIRLGDTADALRTLAAAGITAREACGNAVRNVTACPWAGVSPSEAFDVTPYAEAVTRHFLRHPLSSSLPRKFKIAFEGCTEDHAETAINDLGFRAGTRDGRRGFRLAVGGGTATSVQSATVLLDFLPLEETLSVAEAVLRVFHRLGDRKHRERNRLKFLIRTLGWDPFRAEVLGELDAIRAAGGIPLPFDAENPPEELAPTGTRPEPPGEAEIARRVRSQTLRGPGFVPVVDHPASSPASFPAWLRTNVREQRQPGYVTVSVSLPLGDATSEQLRVLAALSRSFGDGTIRFTSNQDLALRWVRSGDAARLHTLLAAAGLGLPGADTILDVAACPGAEACRLAVTQSRGVGRLLEEHLRASPRALELAQDLTIKVSGCPNGCSRHHVAGIGLQGGVRRVGDRSAPHYFLLVGGDASGTSARFGRLAGRVPVRRVPAAVDRLLELYEARRTPGERALDFFGRVELDEVKRALKEIAELDPATAEPEHFVDLGEEKAFAVDTQEGECAS